LEVEIVHFLMIIS